MNKQICHIKYLARRGIPKDWKFTGRIKYKKYDSKTSVSFEISYEARDWSFDPPGWKLWLAVFTGIALWERPMKTNLEWLGAGCFYFEEIPTEEIVNCN